MVIAHRTKRAAYHLRAKACVAVCKAKAAVLRQSVPWALPVLMAFVVHQLVTLLVILVGARATLLG